MVYLRIGPNEMTIKKKDELDEETLPTLRGNNLYFGNLYNHVNVHHRYA
jgi:hypothetical protein